MGINFKDSQASLEQASAIARDLEKLLKQQEDLISGTKAAASGLCNWHLDISPHLRRLSR